MKLKYLINNDDTNYIQFSIDRSAKKIKGIYIKDGIIDLEKTVDVTDILSVEPTKNPEVQVMKKGHVWDFHLIKVNAYGEQLRRSIGLLVPSDVTATKLEIENDSIEGLTLKNYITHDLDVYKSPLAIAEFPFTHFEGISGISSAITSSLEMTPEGQLKIGSGADISLDLFGEAALNASELPFMMMIKIDKLASNDVSAQHQLEFQLGDNRFTVDNKEGITLESPLSLDPEIIFTPLEIPTGPFVIRLIVNGMTALCTLNNQTKILANYNQATIIDRIQLYGFCDTGEYSLVDHVYMHALENYRQDAVPPVVPQGIRAIAGDRKILVKWDANQDIDLAGYRVYVNSQLHSFGIIKTNEYEVNDIPNGVPARISIVAVDKSGNASPSTQVIEIKPVSSSAKEVSTPDALISNETVELTWGLPTYDGFNGINIYRTNKVDNSKLKLTSLLPSETMYVDSPLPATGRYIYLITTVDIHNNESSGIEIFQEIM